MKENDALKRHEVLSRLYIDTLRTAITRGDKIVALGIVDDFVSWVTGEKEHKLVEKKDPEIDRGKIREKVGRERSRTGGFGPICSNCGERNSFYSSFISTSGYSFCVFCKPDEKIVKLWFDNAN